jgi:sulfate transport system substrate-binding protein
VQRGIGEVLIAWENEAYLALKEFGADKFEIVTPSLSILAEPPVAVVETVAARHGTTELAKAYLQYLYSEEGQDIAGKNFYRPRDPKAAAKFAGQFGKVELVTINEGFGGWSKAQSTHFADGGVFDQIYTPAGPQ